MKKNDWLLLLSVILYSILFYDQSAGINFLLFSVTLVSFLLIRDQTLIRNKVWIGVALGTLTSGVMVFWYGSALALWGNILSLLILAVVSIDARVSFFSSIIISFVTISTSAVFMFIDWSKRKSEKIEGVYRRPFYVKLLLIVLPLLIGILFFFFYQNSNPLFKDFTKDINLDFISIPWIFFTISGLLLLYGFFYNKIMSSIMNWDAQAPLELTREMVQENSFWNKLMRIENEFLSGMILFSILNCLLLIVNVLDLNYLWFDGKLPEGITHKQFVHNGVGVLITSIIIAILIILFYFRGGINFYEKNKWIRWMTYIWIVQNLFMLFSTGYRNNLYIEESGLSYKKIGVYVYLLLTFIGLCTTFYKVYKLRTNWYLFKINGVFYYYILIVSALPNWDVLITDFNIRKHTEGKKDLEKYLLLDLSYKNLPQLYSLPDSTKNKEDLKARDYYNFLRGSSYTNFRKDLDKKYYNFMKDHYELDWQSWCLEKERTYTDLLKMSGTMKSLDLSGNYGVRSLRSLEHLTSLKTLDLSNTYFQNLEELSLFPGIERLDLSDNNLESVAAFPELKQIKYLDLSNNNLQEMKKLGDLTSLEELDISGYNSQIHSIAPLFKLRKLKKITVQNISGLQVDLIKKYFPQAILIVK
ncbi:MAG: DUF4173 domain-containing protein [Bacteroidia bacterium]|nr:DUF4173 domain-containing protein [Bacteroidia bacterium]